MAGKYFGSKISARFGKILVVASARAQKRLCELTAPFICFTGDADTVCDPEGSMLLCEHASSADKTLRVYQGKSHEILHEDIRYEMLDEIATWLEDRLPG